MTAGHSMWTVQLGPGPRLAGLQSLLASLTPAAESLDIRVGTQADLAGLLGGFEGPGRLLLDADHLLFEEIGFVRRFLAGHPDWSLVLVGEDAGRQTARAVLALERSSWMPWPPDLEQLNILASPPRQLLPRSFEAVPSDSARSADLADLVQCLELSFAALRESSQVEGEVAHAVSADIERLRDFALGPLPADQPPRTRTSPSRKPGEVSVFDLAGLLEEELAAMTVRGRNEPRFLFRSGGPLELRSDRDELRQAFRQLFVLARSCAAPGDIIRVLANPEGDEGILVEINAPHGSLEGLPLDDRLEPLALGERLPDLEIDALGHALEVLVASGAELSVEESDDRWTLRTTLRRHSEAAA